jgi:catalase-peroxidase
VLAALESIRQKSSSGISMADMIVLAGCAGVEAAAKAAGHASVEVPFIGGRTDATQEMTDEESFAVLEPIADGFRNYDGRDDEKTASSASGKNPKASAEVLLVEKARMLNLSKAEMAVLVGGMRVMGATHSTAKEVGLLTATPGQLNNAYFVNLLDLNTEWVPAKSTGKDLPNLFVGKDRATGQVKWSASRCDLVFGSHGELRAVAEHYACDDGQAAFVKDFVQVWAKVMNLDRYDLLNNKIFNPASCCEIS